MPYDELPTREQENERALLSAAGLGIAYRIKQALPDDWTVVYYDIDLAARRGWRPGFEYRIWIPRIVASLKRHDTDLRSRNRE